MSDFLADLRHGVRRLGRAPAFTAVAVLTLALGIGANSAIYSLVRAVLLRPLPYADPARLVMIWNPTEQGGTTWLSAREIVAYGADAAAGFEGVEAMSAASANLTGAEAEPERVVAANVTPGAFATLGVAPLLGRAFAPAEGAPGGDAVAVLGHGLWRRRFGGAPDIVGRSVQINGRPHTVVGVMPPAFRLPLDYREARPSELWLPLVIDRANPGDWGNRGLVGFARLRPGVTPARATAALDAAERGWVRDGHIPDQSGGRGLGRSGVPVRELVLGDVRRTLLVLWGAVGFILLIACANVANLLLARADERRREVAIRSALGAGAWRLTRQLLTESLLLAGLGAALGSALAWVGMRALVALDPAGLPRVEEAGVDAGVLAFTAALALATGVLFGVAPALQLARPGSAAGAQPGGALINQGPTRSVTATRSSQRFRRTLTVAEMAFSVVLVVGAVLLVRSLFELRRIDLGFVPHGVLTARVAPPQSEYPSPAAVVAFHERLIDRVTEIRGVRSAAATRILPLTGTIGDWSITIEGRSYDARENPNGDWQVVTPGYFETMSIPLVRGRFLTRADDADAPIAAVINRTMAERYWPGEDALGKRFHLGTANQPWVTVVGIIGTVRHNAVVEQPRAEMYLPHAQFPPEVGFAPRAMTLVVRTDGDPLAAVAPLREAVRALDPKLPMDEVRTLEQVAGDALARERFAAMLLALFAALALALAAVGIYGLVSLLVTQRTRELGIRLALGARSRTILGMVLGQGMALAGAGVALGLAGALLLTRLLDNLLYGVTALDPLTFAVVPLILGAVALAACLIPARRAASVDPMVALRGE